MNKSSMAFIELPILLSWWAMLKKMDIKYKILRGSFHLKILEEIQKIQRTCPLCFSFALPTLSGQWGMLEKMDVKNKNLQGFSSNDNFFWIDADTKYLSNMLFICVTNSIKLVWDAQEDGRREQRSGGLLSKWKFQRDTNTKDLSNMLSICITNSVRSVGNAWEDGRQEQNFMRLLFK
jgi:hypothetical protein